MYEQISYIVVKEIYEKSRTAYGIAVCQKEKSGELVPIETISDICCEYESIARLAESCNRLKLSPTHIYEVIEDFLNR